MVDEGTRKTLSSIPLLQTKAGPRDKELWIQRLKEEYQCLIKVSVYLEGGVKHMFIVYLCFSTSRIIRRLITIGSDWSLIRKALNGLENVGISMRD